MRSSLAFRWPGDLGRGVDFKGDHFPLWSYEINHEYLSHISLFLFHPAWPFSEKLSPDSVQPITDLNQALNYHFIIIKGLSAGQCWTPGGSILKRLLMESYTLAKATEPSQLPALATLTSIK